MNMVTWQVLLVGAVTTGIMAWSVYSSLLTNNSWLGLLMDITDGDKLIITYAWVFTSAVAIDWVIVWILFGRLTAYEIELTTEKMTHYLISFLMLTTSSYSEGNTILMVIFTIITFTCRFIHIVLDNRTDLFTTRILNNLHEYGSRKQVALAFLLNPNFWIIFFLSGFEFLTGAVLLYDIDEYQKLTLITFGFHFVLLTILSMAKIGKLLVTLYETTRYFSPPRNTEDSDFDVLDLGASEEDVDDDNDELIWEAKAYYVRGIKIAASLLELLANCRMMYLLYIFTNQFPLTGLPGVFFSIKTLTTQIVQLRKFIKAADALETAVENATQQDLSEADSSCIVCFETMYSVEEYDRKHPHKPLNKRRHPKKLLCGHILHMGCLKQWLERSDSCPMCRRKVMIAERTIPLPTAIPEPQPENRPVVPEVTEVPHQPPQTAQMNVPLMTEGIGPSAAELGEQNNLHNRSLEVPSTEGDETITEVVTPTKTVPFESGDQLVVRVALGLFVPKHWMALPLRRTNGDAYEIPGASGALLHANTDNENYVDNK